AEAGKMQSGASASLNLKRLTAFAGGPIVEMRGSRPAVGEMHASGLVQLRVHADECLFAGVPFAGRPLVEIDGVDPEEATRLLSWQVQNANRYANFEDAATVMLVRPSTEGMMTRDWNWNQWITFAAEPAAGVGKRLGKVDFDNPPAGLASLGTFKPGDAAVKSMVFPDLEGKKPIDVGAAIERLPTPAKFE
ncbi:MAG TPA: hypothetical protein VLM40_20240, partial [Gemmata sp.]|nr:hypothetical protein [Gemmata sp.]